MNYILGDLEVAEIAEHQSMYKLDFFFILSNVKDKGHKIVPPGIAFQLHIQFLLFVLYGPKIVQIYIYIFCFEKKKTNLFYN